MEGAAAGGEGGFGVGDFGDVVEAVGLEMGFDGWEEAVAGFALGGGVVAADADPGFDEGTDEPLPDDALMVGAVALEQCADVAEDVVR